MDFSFGKDEEAFREEIKHFAVHELPKDVFAFTDEYTHEMMPFIRKTARKLGERRWLGLGWPEEYGGQNAPVMKQLVFQEESSYWGIPGRGMGGGGTEWVGPTLLQIGNDEQKKRFLRPISRGEEFWCTGYTEPQAGSDLASLQTKARLAGDSFIVDGQKVYTSNAHIADWCWMAVRTDPGAPKHKGISLLVVDMKSAGITVRPLLNMAGGHHFNEVYFDSVRVPRENLMGEQNKGWYYLMKALESERVWPGIKFTFRAARLLDILMQYVGATGRELTPNQRQELAELGIELEVAKLLGRSAVSLLAKGADFGDLPAKTKTFATEVLDRVVGTGMKILGLYSQLEERSTLAPLKGLFEEQYMTKVGAHIAGGSSEIQRNIIAMRGLGLPDK